MSHLCAWEAEPRPLTLTLGTVPTEWASGVENTHRGSHTGDEMQDPEVEVRAKPHLLLERCVECITH